MRTLYLAPGVSPDESNENDDKKGWLTIDASSISLNGSDSSPPARYKWYEIMGHPPLLRGSLHSTVTNVVDTEVTEGIGISEGAVHV